MSGIRSVDSLVAPAIAETLGSLDLKPEDAAAAKMAERYAHAIDTAHFIAKDAEKIDLSNADEDTIAKVEALRKRVAAHTAISEIGPKLVALLNDLGATPKARAAKGMNQKPSGPSKLDGFLNRAG